MKIARKNTLRNRTPETWAILLNQIVSYKTRIVCANIVWWDYLSDKLEASEWPCIREYQKCWNVKVRWIKAGLIRIGYLPETAEHRAKTPYNN